MNYENNMTEQDPFQLLQRQPLNGQIKTTNGSKWITVACGRRKAVSNEEK